jgi:hypothetical protein
MWWKWSLWLQQLVQLGCCWLPLQCQEMPYLVGLNRCYLLFSVRAFGRLRQEAAAIAACCLSTV